MLWDVLLTPFVLPPVMAHVPPARTRRGPRPDGASTTPAASAPRGSQRSRLRLIVIQALVFSLFATLFVRLYYLQVVSGEEYQAQAASQSVREIVVQPQRGLIVDDHGPAAGRQPHARGWSRSTAPCSARWTERQQRRLLERVGAAVDRRADAQIRKRLVTCGDAGSVAGHLLERLALPAGAGRPATSAEPVALRILEQPEDFPAVLAEQQTVRAYPRPFGINARPRARLPQPDHRGRVRPGARTTATARSTAPPSVGRAGVEKQYDAWLRGMPGYQRVAVDSMGRVLGDDGEVAGQPGDTLVTSIDAKVQGVVEQQLARDDHDRPADPRHRSPAATTSPTPAPPS